MAIIYGIADSEKQLVSKYPKEVRKSSDIPDAYKQYQKRMQQKETGIFGFIKQWNKKRNFKKFEKNRHSKFHAGARGENKVIVELSKLDNSYHVMCGVRVMLPYVVTYREQKNLRSAQMDVVVVSRKGVHQIEVKNWSDSYSNNPDRNPHEQTERAGRVLWISLQSWFHKPRVTNVLLSVNGNMRYDPNYPSVFVISLDKINHFLQKQNNILSDKEIARIVGKLEWHVTQ